MRTRLILSRILLGYFLSIGTMSIPAAPQMVAGKGFVVRSDATTPVTIEYQVNNEWRQVVLQGGKDVTLTGDRIRVATKRDEDGAMITVDLPVQAGKKYRLIRNPQSGIWDFSRT